VEKDVHQMQLISDLALPHLPVETPAFDEDPTPFLKAARVEHPWLAKVSQGYFVHGFQAVKDLNSMDDKLRPAFDGVVAYYGAEDTAWGRWMMEHIIAIWGPKHARIRSSIAGAFTPRNVNRFRGLMRERISQLLDAWVPKGKFDFVDFASDFPISIMCGMLGTSTEAIPRIREALEAQGRSFSLNKELVPEFLAGFDVMWEYVDTLVIEREKSGRMGEDTLLDALIATKNAGQIDETELRYLLLVLFPAGYDTSRNFLAYTIHTLLDYPDYWERCAADLDFCGKVVDEMLRYNSISTAFARSPKTSSTTTSSFPRTPGCSSATASPAAILPHFRMPTTSIPNA
jgi:cytochrome P450